MSNKKDILWINTVFPDPPTDGNKLRNYNLIVNLSKDFNIHYLSYFDKNEISDTKGTLSRACKSITTVELAKPRDFFMQKIIDKIRLIFSLRPKFCSRKEERVLKNKIDLIVEKFGVSCIICASPWVWQPSIAKKNLPLILDEQNVEYLLLKDLFKIEKFGLRKISRYFDFYSMRHFEKRLLSEFNAVTVATEDDARKLSKLDSKQDYAIVPNGVDLSYWKYRCSDSSHKIIVFTGGMSYFPNADAMDFFLETIFPLILKEESNLRLFIAGKNPPDYLREKANKFNGKVVLTGFCKDIREIIYTGSVFIVPIRAGSGSRLKILEAMAAGVPVVSTSKGAEGISVTNEKDILICDTADSFKDSVISLLRNRELGLSLAKNARKLVEELYGWEKITTIMKELIDRCTR